MSNYLKIVSIAWEMILMARPGVCMGCSANRHPSHYLDHEKPVARVPLIFCALHMIKQPRYDTLQRVLTLLALTCVTLAVTRVAVGLFHHDEKIREQAGKLIDEKTLLYLGLAGGLLLLKDVKSLAYGDLKLEFERRLEEVRVSAENAQAAATGQGGKREMQHSIPEATASLGPISPGKVPDDPWKGVFGEPASNTRQLEAQIVPSANPGYYRVYLKVKSLDPETNPLTGSVQFFLHDSFANDKPVVAVGPNGIAQLTLDAWGAFTVGAIADSGNTRLELDLSKLEDAPAAFKGLTNFMVADA
ncbi:pYEATS domain-containing protein [Cyanobium sp. NIES-981]|uniref:pYEATS domain-containing protein n=1 Tax=Cyanobium sp. NIES-981 TaxID=1851505 RepID=UPI0012F8F297|nr:pYEATS domain-containing protein [Cyanobium sp. NIES-981]